MRRFFLAVTLLAIFVTSAFAFWPFGGGTKVVLSVGEPLKYEKGDKEIALRYKLLDQEDRTVGGRRRSEIRIQCAREFDKADDDTLKEIVVALKKEHASRAAVFSVFAHFPPRSSGMGDIVAHYAEDKKGFSGDQDWEWEIQRNTEALDALEKMKSEKKEENFETYAGSGGGSSDADLTEPRKKVLALYDELLALKDTKEFREKGFAATHKRGHAWLKKTEALRDEFHKSDYPITLKIAPGDLLQLGLEYVTTKGRENNETAYFREQLDEELKGR